MSARRVMATRLGWAIWAVLPVLGLAHYFGPGQRALSEDLAARVIERAQLMQEEAIEAQEAAYERHLDGIRARVAAFGSEDSDLATAAQVAGEAEAAADAIASDRWQRTADALQDALKLIEASDADLQQRVRLVRARALIRAGDIGTGADDLELLLTSLGEVGQADSALGLEAREELATAYYYGARLLRLAGQPGERWREVSGRARQNFRYLAEQTRVRHGRDDAIANFEKNGELVLNLEQSSLDELYARPRPKDSPSGAGSRLGEERRRGRGPRRGDQPADGASLDGEIGQGW